MNAPPVGHPTPDTALSPLEQAGLRLDAARATFTAAVNNLLTGEQSFGDAEDAYATAVADYRERLREVTGCDPDDIQRRLA